MSLRGTGHHADVKGGAGLQVILQRPDDGLLAVVEDDYVVGPAFPGPRPSTSSMDLSKVLLLTARFMVSKGIALGNAKRYSIVLITL